MVQVISQPRPSGDYWWQQNTGSPLIHIHFIERNVFGNGIGVRVYGELKIAAGEIVYAREMKLNCLQVLSLTSEVNANEQGAGYVPSKWIYHKSEFDNFASIDIFDTGGTWQGAGTGPTDGSIWLDFIALGE